MQSQLMYCIDMTKTNLRPGSGLTFCGRLCGPSVSQRENSLLGGGAALTLVVLKSCLEKHS